MKTNQKNRLKKLLYILVAIVAINCGSNYLYKRFDLTSDQRFTLSDVSLNSISKIKEPVYIDVFLDGNLPPNFKRLQAEARQLLEEYSALNHNIVVRFNNPLKDEEVAEQYAQEMISYGMIPTNVQINTQGKKEQIQIFPWAIANINEKSVKIPLLLNNYGNNPEENINQSVQLLEYAFTDGLEKLTSEKKQSIAILKGNGQIGDKYMADYLLGLKEYYALGEFNLDSLKNDLPKTLENLKRFDAAIIAKPTEAFSDEEKYILDQYIMQGGKTMWLIDKVHIDLDHLANDDQVALAAPMDLNLDDLFFKYGVRINPRLIQDLFSTPVTAKNEDGSDLPIDWLYSPTVRTESNHLINKNVNLIKLEFANQIDTLNNGIKKTVILKSSPITKVVGAPVLVGLNQFMRELEEEEFKSGEQIVGTLLEGSFTSVFKNRVKPFKINQPIENGKANKMIVIADGDIINYTYANKKLLINGYDQWTQQVYGNKNFLTNAMNYLLDDNGIVKIRGKQIELPTLDTRKVTKEYTATQIKTIGIPLVLLAIFGFAFYYIRKKKYA